MFTVSNSENSVKLQSTHMETDLHHLEYHNVLKDKFQTLTSKQLTGIFSSGSRRQ